MVSELMVPEGVLHMCICQFAHSRWLRGIEPEIKKLHDVKIAWSLVKNFSIVLSFVRAKFVQRIAQ